MGSMSFGLTRNIDPIPYAQPATHKEPVHAGTSNCLRAVRLLTPTFKGKSNQSKVGKLLEGVARQHQTRARAANLLDLQP